MVHHISIYSQQNRGKWMGDGGMWGAGEGDGKGVGRTAEVRRQRTQWRGQHVEVRAHGGARGASRARKRHQGNKFGQTQGVVTVSGIFVRATSGAVCSMGNPMETYEGLSVISESAYASVVHENTDHRQSCSPLAICAARSQSDGVRPRTQGTYRGAK